MLERDIYNTNILIDYPKIVDLLLHDFTTKKNILWATDNYIKRGKGYGVEDHILDIHLKGRSKIIKPRIEKSKLEQTKRSRDKAEVFTPSWIVNKQNNLVDESWFDNENGFNVENEDNTWTVSEKIIFKEEKNWKDYVNNTRLEVCCGEGPYLVSRYDTTTGIMLELKNRVGLLDRKFRVINENATTDDEWIEFSLKALKSIYGYEFQGDNLLIARENVLLDYLDYYIERFKKMPDENFLLEIVKIISWNIWQMDGLKLVVPFTCHHEKKEAVQLDLFDVVEDKDEEICTGCKLNDPKKHNGKRCYIMDWEKGRKIKFVSLMWRKGEYVG